MVSDSVEIEPPPTEAEKKAATERKAEKTGKWRAAAKPFFEGGMLGPGVPRSVVVE